MAGKQLGKFRQWAGEVISARDKTTVSDEFKDLEHDVELRRQGLLKVHVTSEAYKDAISKKRECEVLPDDKLLPLDAFGVIMIQHGEEFGDESAFGTSLVSLGRAHCQIATLQETFAISFEDTYLKSIKRSEADIKEYQNERKKLESRRLTYDATLTKYEKLKDNKSSKKDKERREAEDEYEIAKLRFEETQADVEIRMHNIQENEVVQLRDLTSLLELEISCVQQHLGVLKDVKASWIDEEVITQMESTHRRIRRSPPPVPPSIIPLSASRSAEDDSTTASNPASRFNSVRSSKSSQPPATPKSHSRRSSKAPSIHLGSSSSESDSESEGGSEGESDGGKKKKGGLRERARSLTSRRKSDAGSKNGSRAPSRSGSVKGRKRADSEATVGRDGKDKDGKDKDGKDKEKEKEKKKMSVTGWASSKVSGFPGMGKSKKEREREREKFSALMDDRDDIPSDGPGGDTEEFDPSGDEEFGVRRPESALSASSKKSGGKKDKVEKDKKGKNIPTTPGASPKISTRLIRNPSSNPPSPHGSSSVSHTSLSSSSPKKHKRKIVVALHDFTASSSDELSFKVGDRILVTNEVVDGWWMGEILSTNGDGTGGKKGMFPTNHTKVLPDRPSPTISSNSSSSSVSSSSGLKPALSRRKTEEPGSGRSSLDGIVLHRARPIVTVGSSSKGSSYPYPSPTPSSSDRSFASVDDHPFGDGDQDDSQHPFGDQHHYISSGRSPVNGHFYAESIGGSEVDDLEDEQDSLVTTANPNIADFPVSFNSHKHSQSGTSEKEKDVIAQLARKFSGPAPPPVPPPPMTRRVTDGAGGPKKPPPPPPPRRSTNNALNTPTLSSSILSPSTPTPTNASLPYVPRRPPTQPGGGSSQSSMSSSFLGLSQVGSRSVGSDGVDSAGLTFSPFDDHVGGGDGGCGSFKQNPFKAKGFCGNCTKMHS